MADRLSRVTSFFLGTSPRAEDDDFEAEFDDDDEMTDVVEMEPAKAPVSPRSRAVRQTAAPSASVTSLEQHRRPTARPLAMSEILHVRPYAFAEAARIGESYRDGVPVILNLSTTDEKQAQKLIDFCSGMAFYSGGKLEKITSRVFLVVPATVQLSQADKNQLAEKHQLGE